MSLEKLHTHYRLTVEVLTPLHIGSGRELIRDYDFVARGGRTWVINQQALLEASLDADGTFNNELLRVPAAQLLTPEDYHPGSPFFHYIMPGEPANRPLSEQIKDVWGNPYLPGSSIKGALRTMLLWSLYTVGKLRPNLGRLGDRDKYAAQALEREMLAPGAREPREAPNKDLLKAVHVSDSAPVGPNALRVKTARVFPTGQRGGGVDVDVEAIERGTVFEMQLSIDEYGFADSSALEKLGWEKMRAPLNVLPRIGQHHSVRRITQEREYYQQKSALTQAQEFYSWLGNQSPPANAWFMQLGWGAGWNSKTLNELLLEQPAFENVIKQYRLDRGRRKQGQPFPASRKLVVVNGQPATPMGWIKCRLEPI